MAMPHNFEFVQVGESKLKVVKDLGMAHGEAVEQ